MRKDYIHLIGYQTKKQTLNESRQNHQQIFHSPHKIKMKESASIKNLRIFRATSFVKLLRILKKILLMKTSFIYCSYNNGRRRVEMSNSLYKIVIFFSKGQTENKSSSIKTCFGLITLLCITHLNKAEFRSILSSFSVIPFVFIWTQSLKEETLCKLIHEMIPYGIRIGPYHITITMKR